MNTMEARLFVARFISGSYTLEEYGAFLHWMDEAPLNELEQVIGEHETLKEEWLLGVGPSAGWIEQMEQQLDLADSKDQQMPVRKPAPARPVKRLSWMAAAASVLVLSGLCAYWYVSRSGPSKGSSLNKTETLSILSVPRGQQGWIQLADGSKAWLNSASTLHYPSTFTGKERVVELSGEALFEIAPNADVPFLVRSGDIEVQVLGTRFDMKSYTDEPISKIALLNGSVKIVRGQETATLHPRDQAEMGHLSPGGKTVSIKVKHGIDQGSVLAWKDGYMEFKNNDLHAVMREIARSYDFDIQYQGKIAERYFTGKFSRNDNISQILKILELQNVHFKIDRKLITVLP